MKIAHFADSHLGAPCVGIQRRVNDPWRPGVLLRQREVDLLTGFERTVSALLEAEPQLVLHAGDLFDTARPSAHIVSFAMSQLKRLSDKGIAVVLIEGNNSYPRDPALGHAHEILAHIPNIHVVFDGPTVLTFGDVVVHAYPHRATARGQWPEEQRDGAEFRVLLAHGIADGHTFFRGDRPAAILNVREVAEQFDYVALGHYHRFTQVPDTENAFYSGASAMVSWSDFRPAHEFGFNLVESESGLVTSSAIETRPMAAYGLDDASGLTRAEIVEYLQHQHAEVPCAGTNCHVVVRNIAPLARRELSVRDVEGLFADHSALQITLGVHEQRWEDVRSGLVAGGGLPERFRALAQHLDGDEEFRQAVELVGLEVLQQAGELVGEEELGEVGP